MHITTCENVGGSSWVFLTGDRFFCPSVLTANSDLQCHVSMFDLFYSFEDIFRGFLPCFVIVLESNSEMYSDHVQMLKLFANWSEWFHGFHDYMVWKKTKHRWACNTAAIIVEGNFSPEGKKRKLCVLHIGVLCFCKGFLMEPLSNKACDALVYMVLASPAFTRLSQTTLRVPSRFI